MTNMKHPCKLLACCANIKPHVIGNKCNGMGGMINPKFTLCGILPISQSTAIKLCLKSIPGDLFVSDTSKHSPSNPPLNPSLKIPQFSHPIFL